MSNFAMPSVTHLDGGDEKSYGAAASLLEELVQICRKDSILSASNRIRQLYEEGELPSNLFTPQTDHLLAPAIVKIVPILKAKKYAQWVDEEFSFLTQLMNLACGPAMVEERGGNLACSRWLGVISSCFTLLPADTWPFSLWLFTFTWPHDSLFKPALEKLDRRISWTTDMWTPEEVKAYRDRSLCRFERELAEFDAQCSKDFNEKLKGTKECDHFHFCCVESYLWSYWRSVKKSVQKAFCVTV